MRATAEQPASDSEATLIPEERTTAGLPPRRRKDSLPQIHDLALEGHSCREIAARLGVSKSSVNRWLQELRQECRAKVADSAEMVAVTYARYEAIYREAMEAWRRSQADKEVRLVEETATAGGSKKKRSVRHGKPGGRPGLSDPGPSRRGRDLQAPDAGGGRAQQGRGAGPRAESGGGARGGRFAEDEQR